MYLGLEVLTIEKRHNSLDLDTSPILLVKFLHIYWFQFQDYKSWIPDPSIDFLYDSQ